MTLSLSNIITAIVIVAIMVAAFIVTRVALPYLQEKGVLGYVTKAVSAAEQLYKNVAGAGEDKNRLVKLWVKKYLKKHNIKCISDDDIDVLIEAAVYYMNETKSVVLDAVELTQEFTVEKDVESAINEETVTAEPVVEETPVVTEETVSEDEAGGDDGEPVATETTETEVTE